MGDWQPSARAEFHSLTAAAPAALGSGRHVTPGQSTMLSGRRRRAVALAFVANGLAGPSFLARIPERQAALGMSDAELGLVLTGMAFGALLASRVAGRLVGAYGSRRVLLVSWGTLGAVVWLAGAAPSPLTLFGALVTVGGADAAMDIAMNANGAELERRAGRSLLHSLHAAWSLGALGAGGLAAAAASASVPLALHLLLVGGVIVVLVGWSRPRLVHDRHRLPIGAAARMPAARRGWRRPLAVLAAATVGGAVIEGAPADWGAVQLHRFGVATGASSLAFAAFAAGMVGGRLVGDHMTDRLGPATVLRGGMGLAAIGIASGVLLADPVVFTLGLVLAGFGASGFFPLAFSAAARMPGVLPGAGVATVSLAARIGFLIEPLIVGAGADLIGLRPALGVVAAIAVTLVLSARRVTP